MRITVLGAGPAGLYFSILASRAHEITVIERNPPDATYGWGVVFSEETLARLHDADEPTHEAIAEAFATWTTIDVHYQGETIRSRGHGFSAISRRTLLKILQDRARELGVELRFKEDIAALQELPEANLLVGADGANSLVRRARGFDAQVRPYPTRFAWYGTDLVLDAFTFAFTHTEHGLFQAHAYPFDAERSTFIVEMREDTWRRAGLDTMNEAESMAFCEDLFAPVLRGHRLLSNRSIWLAFQEVRTATWSDGDTVLLGDAAHTAHFSIGSGTKLAMEDAIELAAAVGRGSLVDYELERRPVVERFQDAARQSAEYFEQVPRHWGLHPLQFAFNLLTRSGRIGHANLTQRDPALVRRVDAHVAGAPLAAPPLFAPLRLGDLELPNRAVSRDPGSGAALLLTPPVAVTPDGRITPECPLEWEVGPERVMLCLSHAGRRGATRPRAHGADLPLRDGGWPLVSASPIRYTPRSAVPAELDETGMARIRDAFAAAAERAAAAGVAVLELNLAEGYLLGSFLSPLSNRRTDAYGADRLRFPLAVVNAVRATWPGPLAARIPATDWAPGGLTPDDAVAIATALREAGCALVHVVAGHATAHSRPEYRRGYLTAFSDHIRSEARIATLVGGYLDTLDAANTIIGAGRADLCLLEEP